MSGIKEWIGGAQDACFNASFNAGWWHKKDGTPLWTDPLAFSNRLMLTVSELAEAMEADRKNLMDDKLPHRKGTEVEIADAIIRLLDLAGAYGLDVGGAMEEKMAFNKVRPDHKKEAREASGGKSY